MAKNNNDPRKIFQFGPAEYWKLYDTSIKQEVTAQQVHDVFDQKNRKLFLI